MDYDNFPKRPINESLHMFRCFLIMLLFLVAYFFVVAGAYSVFEGNDGMGRAVSIAFFFLGSAAAVNLVSALDEKYRREIDVMDSYCARYWNERNSVEYDIEHFPPDGDPVDLRSLERRRDYLIGAWERFMKTK